MLWEYKIPGLELGLGEGILLKVTDSFCRLALFLFGPFSPRYTTSSQMPDIEKRPLTPPAICISFDTDSMGQVSVTPTVLDASLTENKSQESVEEKQLQQHQYPEGGLKAYLTVLGAFIALGCTFGQMSAFGTFQTWYTSHQLRHLSASTISWIGSLQLWLFFFSVRFNFDLSVVFSVFNPAWSDDSGSYHRTHIWCIRTDWIDDRRNSLLSHEHHDNQRLHRILSIYFISRYIVRVRCRSFVSSFFDWSHQPFSV